MDIEKILAFLDKRKWLGYPVVYIFSLIFIVGGLILLVLINSIGSWSLSDMAEFLELIWDNFLYIAIGLAVLLIYQIFKSEKEK